MTSLKCWNSGVASKDGAFINLPSLAIGERLSANPFSALLALLSGSGVPSARLSLAELASQFLVRHAASYDLLHDNGEPIRIGHLAIVKPECLFIAICLQVKRLHAYIRALQCSLEKLQKFSMPFVWTAPRT
jgi:hypothetical protein